MAQAADLGTKRLISLAPDAWLHWITGRTDVSAGMSLFVSGKEVCRSFM